MLKGLGIEPSVYSTPDEIAEHSKALLNKKYPGDIPPEEGFAEGGSVQPKFNDIPSVLAHFTKHHPEFMQHA